MDTKKMTFAFVKLMFNALHNDDGISGALYDQHLTFLEDFCEEGQQLATYISKFVDATDDSFYIKEMTKNEKHDFFEDVKKFLSM